MDIRGLGKEGEDLGGEKTWASVHSRKPKQEECTGQWQQSDAEARGWGQGCNRLGKDVSGGCDLSECGQFSLESCSEGRDRVVSS